MKAKKEIMIVLGIIILGIVVNLVPDALATFSSESTSPDDWRMFQRYLNHSGYTNSFAPPNISTAPVITYTNIGLYAYYSGSVSNGTLFFGDNGGVFHALNASNISKVINRRSFDDLSTSPSVAGDSVYLGGDTLDFYQLNLSNTNQTYATYSVPGSNGNAYYGSAVSDGYLYVTTGNDGKFYQFNATNISQFIASYTFGSRTYTEPAIANGYAYLSVSTGSLYQLNASNVSKLIASYNIGTGSSAYSSPSVTENYVYVGSNDNKTYQLNASNVSILVATYTTGGLVWGAPAIAHGYVYIGSNDKVFYQLNASNISIQVSNYTSTSGFLNEITVNDLYAFTTDSSSLYQFDAFNVRNFIGKVSAGFNLGSGPVIAGGYVYMAGGTATKMSQFGTTLPYVTQTQPINNFEFAYALQNITFNCSIDDSKGLENVSLYITGNTNQTFSINQTTNVSGLQTVKANWTLQLDEGNYTWACLVYDNDGNYVWSSNRSMKNDLTAPKIAVTNPRNATKTPDTGLDINYTATDVNLASCWYSNDTYSVNTTLSDCANILTLTWGEGAHNVTIWANDTKGNTGSNLTFFTIDITYPAFVNVTNRTQEYGVALNITINATDTQAISCFTVNDTNFTINCLGQLRNNTIIPIGLYNLNLTVNDTSGNINFTTIWVNVSDTLIPAFTSISNQSIYDLNGLAVDFNATDLHGVSCFSINDTNFTINCTGFMRNNTSLDARIYNLNITINDTSGNVNFTSIVINVTLKPFVGIQLLYPTADLNATRYQLFNVSVNVSCTRANCNGINITLSTVFENASDMNIAFVCYNTGCSDADDFVRYLNGQGFRVTNKTYTSWTDGDLNETYFNAMVVGGDYQAGYYAFDSAADIARDAFEDEALPTVVALDTGYTPSNLGITTTTCTTDSSDNNIIDIQSHEIMTGFGSNLSINTSGSDICYYTAAQMTDPYTKLFAPEDAGTANIAGFALNAGAATIGTNPGKFVYLGFDTVDSYSATQNDSVIINQAICWAATGAYNCAPARTINTLSNATPFFTNLTNPYNISLSQDESIILTFWVNASGTIGRYHEVFLVANKTSESTVSNATSRYNITISSGNTGPTVTIASPNDGIFSSDTGLDINYVASSDTLSKCWYTNESNTGNITLTSCANITDVVWPEGIHNLTIYANDSTGQSSDTVSFIIDTTNPLISVNIPRNASYSNDAAQDINYSASDTYLASCWYSNDSYSVNTTLASCANITSLNWATGMHNVTIWANDSAGNKNSTIVFFTIDITSPLISINYPSNSSFISDALAYVNYSVSDTNLASCWYSNDTYSKNTTLASCANITGLRMAEGKHNLTVWANDSAGNTNSNIIFFTIDTIKPSILFNPASFQSQAPQSFNYIYVNVSSSDTNDNFKFVDFDNDMLLWLRMDNLDSSGNPVDSSSYALTLNSSNNTGQNSSGRFGKAFNFNGSGFFTLQRPVKDSFSICTWIKTNVKGGSTSHWQLAPIIESECSFADNDFGFGIDKFGYIALGTGPADITINSTTNVSDNNWHFVCGTRDISSGNLSVYVDGNFEKAKNSSTTSLTCNSLATIGYGTDGASYFSGLMDELLIWNRTLSSAEISAIYNFSATSPNYLNNFTGIADRNHSATAYSVDAVGNINSTSSYILVDTIPPWISILSPSNNSFTANYQVSVNYSAADSYLASCWYSNDTYSKNTTLASCANITGLRMAEGKHNLTLWANDSAGNTNSTILFFTIDTTYPAITIVNPANDTVTSNTLLYINYSASDTNIASCWYSNDTYSKNTTLANCANITGLSWGEGFHNVTVYVNDSAGNSNYTKVWFTIDLSDPIIRLKLPVNGGGDHDGNVTFTYNVSDTGPISNCTLILNSALNQTNTTITKDASQYIILSNLKAGRYNWSVNCTDQLGRSNISNIWNFRIINATKFDGVTTDLNSYNLSNVTTLIIEQLSHGKINFTVPVDMSNVTEIDTYVNISANLIEVNSTALSQLNVTAVLTLYNLSFTNPRIMRDNAVCSTGTCSKLAYSGGNLTFNVSHFSSYSAEETPTASTPAAASGGGGGGGSSSGIYITTLANNLFINFRQDREYKIYIKNRYYDTRLLIQTQDHIVMQIGSYVLTLKKGDRQYLDVDNDGTYDLDVILLETSGNIAKVEFNPFKKKLEPEKLGKQDAVKNDELKKQQDAKRQANKQVNVSETVLKIEYPKEMTKTDFTVFYKPIISKLNIKLWQIPLFILLAALMFYIEHPRKKQAVKPKKKEENKNNSNNLNPNNK